MFSLQKRALLGIEMSYLDISALFQRQIEFFWHRRLKSNIFLRHRMYKCQHFCMQTKSINRAELITMTVLTITYHRTSFARQMHTNLIRSPCLEMKFYEGIALLIVDC